jgi:nucleotide-binding universal stress UspA family protein
MVKGIADDEIIKYAKENGIDMIVLGTHGRTGLEHVIFGSTAEKVVRSAPCPVLTVHCPGN